MSGDTDADQRAIRDRIQDFPLIKFFEQLGRSFKARPHRVERVEARPDRMERRFKIGHTVVNPQQLMQVKEPLQFSAYLQTPCTL